MLLMGKLRLTEIKNSWASVSKGSNSVSSDLTNYGSKVFRKKKYSRKFQKAKLESAALRQPFTYHLHCSYSHRSYTVLGVTTDVEMI